MPSSPAAVSAAVPVEGVADQKEGGQKEEQKNPPDSAAAPTEEEKKEKGDLPRVKVTGIGWSLLREREEVVNSVFHDVRSRADRLAVVSYVRLLENLEDLLHEIGAKGNSEVEAKEVAKKSQSRGGKRTLYTFLPKDGGSEGCRFEVWHKFRFLFKKDKDKDKRTWTWKRCTGKFELSQFFKASDRGDWRQELIKVLFGIRHATAHGTKPWGDDKKEVAGNMSKKTSGQAPRDRSRVNWEALRNRIKPSNDEKSGLLGAAESVLEQKEPFLLVDGKNLDLEEFIATLDEDAYNLTGDPDRLVAIEALFDSSDTPKVSQPSHDPTKFIQILRDGSLRELSIDSKALERILNAWTQKKFAEDLIKVIDWIIDRGEAWNSGNFQVDLSQDDSWKNFCGNWMPKLIRSIAKFVERDLAKKESIHILGLDYRRKVQPSVRLLREALAALGDERFSRLAVEDCQHSFDLSRSYVRSKEFEDFRDSEWVKMFRSGSVSLNNQSGQNSRDHLLKWIAAITEEQHDDQKDDPKNDQESDLKNAQLSQAKWLSCLRHLQDTYQYLADWGDERRNQSSDPEQLRKQRTEREDRLEREAKLCFLRTLALERLNDRLEQQKHGQEKRDNSKLADAFFLHFMSVCRLYSMLNSYLGEGNLLALARGSFEEAEAAFDDFAGLTAQRRNLQDEDLQLPELSATKYVQLEARIDALCVFFGKPRRCRDDNKKSKPQSIYKTFSIAIQKVLQHLSHRDVKGPLDFSWVEKCGEYLLEHSSAAEPHQGSRVPQKPTTTWARMPAKGEQDSRSRTFRTEAPTTTERDPQGKKKDKGSSPFWYCSHLANTKSGETRALFRVTTPEGSSQYFIAEYYKGLKDDGDIRFHITQVKEFKEPGGWVSIYGDRISTLFLFPGCAGVGPAQPAGAGDPVLDRLLADHFGRAVRADVFSRYPFEDPGQDLGFGDARLAALRQQAGAILGDGRDCHHVSQWLAALPDAGEDDFESIQTSAGRVRDLIRALPAVSQIWAFGAPTWPVLRSLAEEEDIGLEPFETLMGEERGILIPVDDRRINARFVEHAHIPFMGNVFYHSHLRRHQDPLD